jgi:hypothetical protein
MSDNDAGKLDEGRRIAAPLIRFAILTVPPSAFAAMGPTLP